MPEQIRVAADTQPRLGRPRHRTDAGPEATPPVLLTMASYYGTLAAARSLGAAGIPVTIADPEQFAPARWSRFVSRRVSCPSVQEPERFISWLLEFGARHPGHVLYPTGDDVAWLYALHRGELAKHFRLYQPSVDVIYSLLNKERLRRACNRVGIDMPKTWFLHDGDDIGRLEHELTYPLLVKPQTQILFWPHAKGKVVWSREALRRTYDRLVSRTSYSPTLLAHDPGVARPLLQAYLPHAAQSIYNVSGFVDESGDLFAVRASRKVLQRPRLLGIGVCFEEAEVDGTLEGKILSLCKQAGYHGVFEAEFIEEGGAFLLIDFNPRYYGQMGFDIARGLPLPLMVYEAAIGRPERLQAEVERARSDGATAGRVYCNRFELGLLLRVQRLAGAMNAADDRRWKSWLAAHEGKITDALMDPADRWPGSAQVVHEVLHSLRHPRSFLREFRTEPSLGSASPRRERRSRSYRSVDVSEAERLGRQARTLFPLERSALVEHGVAAGQTILDLGCGQGTFLGLVAEAFTGSRCIGLDRSAPMLVAARQERGVAEVVQCDLADRARLLAELERIGPQTVLCRFVLQHMTTGEREALLSALAEHSARHPLRVVLADVDSDSWFVEPPSPLLAEAHEELDALQASLGGDRRIGARLALLLREAGFSDIRSSRVHVESELVGFPSFWAAFGQVLCAGLSSRPSAREAVLAWSRDAGTAARSRAGFDVFYASASRTRPDG